MGNFKKKAQTGPPSLLVRPRPTEDGSFVAFHAEGDGFGVYFHRDVLEFIKRESLRAAPDEAIGLLAGRTCSDPVHGPYTLVMAADGARGDEVEASPSHVHISAYGNASVRQRLEASHSDREIVGWYHSHPRYPAQFSHIDITEQSTWNDPNHVGIVFSGTEKSEPFGVYRGPEAVRLMRHRTESRMSPAGQTIYGLERVPAKRALPEQVGAERTQPGRPKPLTADIAKTRRIPAAQRGRFSRLRGVAPRLLVLLGALGLAAGVVWLHQRVRSIETALGSTRGVASSSPTPAETPLPEQPSQLPDARSQASAAPQSETGSANRTMLTDGPIAKPAANPLNGSVRRRNNARAGKSKKPAARVKNNKKREATNTRPAESRPVNQ
jgi:proteasome lid subunit RPN8/RPN11